MTTRRPLVLEAFAASLRSTRWLALLLFIVYLFSGTTIVRPGEVVLILRLGRLHGTSPETQVNRSGLLFTFPSPFDQIVRVPVRTEGEVVIQDLWKSLNDNGPAVDAIDPLKEGYCLTGDQNILQTRLVAKYRIDDPVAYAFATEDPQGIVHDSVMAATTCSIASWKVNDALRLLDTQTQKTLASEVMRAAQTRLNGLRCGMVLSGLEFKEIHPPRHLRAEFEKAQSARVQKETMRREAEGFASSRIPQAEAEQNRLIKEAMANGNAILSRANAEISVYRPLLDEFQSAPTLTSERLYRESLEQVMVQIGRRYFLPAQTKSGDVRIFISESENAP